eukprot:505742_1
MTRARVLGVGISSERAELVRNKYVKCFDVANDLAIIEFVGGIAIFGYLTNGELWGSCGDGKTFDKDTICSTFAGQSGSAVINFYWIIGLCVQTNSDDHRQSERVNCGVFFNAHKLNWIKKISGARAEDRSDFCFDGNGNVLMKNNLCKKIADLRIGDEVRSFPNNVSKIKCIVVSNINREIRMVELSDSCWITFEHPILVNDAKKENVVQCENISSLDSCMLNKYGLLWILPKDRYPVQYRYQDKIYNFILDSNHTINVNGNWCCTLGHDYKGDVIQHEFWGNSLVITEFLKAHSSYPYVIFDK